MRQLPVLLLCLLPIFSCAQQLPVPDRPVIAPDVRPLEIGQVLSFRSAVLKEDRILNVWLPDGYGSDSTLRYPVVYVLDGSLGEDFLHIAGLVQFMNMYQLWPSSIVVGIGNVDRYRDFTQATETPSDREKLPQAGGSGRFIPFIADEVMRMMDHHFPTDGTNTLIGQSLGGLLATEILLHHPDLFDRYVIVSPSLWWNKGSLVQEAEDLLKTQGSGPQQVFLSIGTEGEEMQEGMDRLVAALKSHARPPFRWWYEPLPQENHATILHRAVYRAFERMNAPR